MRSLAKFRLSNWNKRFVGNRIVTSRNVMVSDMDSASNNRYDSFLPAITRCSNLTGAHEVANIFLQELVVVVELVMFLANGLDAVKDHQERILQSLCMSTFSSVQ